MSDESKHADPFKPQAPQIPGVTDRPSGGEGAAKSSVPRVPLSAKIPPILLSPTFWILSIGAIVLVLAVAFGIRWWNTARTTHEAQAAAQEGPVAPVVDLAAPAQANENLPFGPGAVATTAQLSKTWSSQRFTFRAPMTADNIPAVVVKLPNGVYWGVSLREPFGNCQMEYVTDLDRLDSFYHYHSDHPMIADPCSHAVFDLLRYGPGPNGMVRGEIVGGAGVRPPIAIEMSVKGKDVIAVKVEE